MQIIIQQFRIHINFMHNSACYYHVKYIPTTISNFTYFYLLAKTSPTPRIQHISYVKTIYFNKK